MQLEESMKRHSRGGFKNDFFLPESVRQPENKRSKKTLVSTRVNLAPLAERLRPRTLDDVVGQDEAIGPGTLLRTAVENGYLPSLILWGPPGCGKTTVGRILAESTGCTFVCMSAAAGGGVAEIKKTIEDAKARQKFGTVVSMTNGTGSGNGVKKNKTVLFLDEIHRFNKSQQDSLLKAVEDGTITLIGATTENPSFEVNSALMSRCRVVTMRRIDGKAIQAIVKKAADVENATIDDDALEAIAQFSDGDARRALNAVEMLLASTPPDEPPAPEPSAASSGEGTDENKTSLLKKQWEREEQEDREYMERTGAASTGAGTKGEDGDDDDVVLIVEDSESESRCEPEPEVKKPHKHITMKQVQEAISSKRLLYDKAGCEHYNLISALHKSVRGGDVDAALYWLVRMIEGGEDPLYIARRIIRMASEDIGMADPNGILIAVAAYQACHFLGYPECDVHLAHAVVYLTQAPKSNNLDTVVNQLKQVIANTGSLPVPLHLRNAPTQLMHDLGYGAGYKYTPQWVAAGLDPSQQYLPDELVGSHFWKNPVNAQPAIRPIPPQKVQKEPASRVIVVQKPKDQKDRSNQESDPSPHDSDSKDAHEDAQALSSSS